MFIESFASPPVLLEVIFFFIHSSSFAIQFFLLSIQFFFSVIFFHLLVPFFIYEVFFPFYFVKRKWWHFIITSMKREKNVSSAEIFVVWTFHRNLFSNPFVNTRVHLENWHQIQYKYQSVMYTAVVSCYRIELTVKSNIHRFI